MDPELAAFLTEHFGEINRHFEDVYRRFDLIDRRFDDVDRRFESMDRRLDAMDQRFDAMDRRLDAMDQRFDGIDQRFESIDRRFEAMDRRFHAMDRKIDERFEEAKSYAGVIAEGLRGEIRAVADGHLVLDRRLEEFREENGTAHREILGMLGSSHRRLDRRVTRLESWRRRGRPRG